MQTRPLLRWLPVLAVLLLCGCLEFEQQTLTYRYEPATDTLKIFQHYQGIFGTDKTNTLSDEELKQLESVLQGDRTFFFSNWIFEYNPAMARAWIEELKKPTEGDDKPEPEMIAHAETLSRLALTNITVTNSRFYLNAEGKLCGVQEVTVKNFSKIIAAANVSIRDYHTHQARWKAETAAERKLLSAFAQRPEDAIILNGNQLRFSLPMTDEEYQKDFAASSTGPKPLAEFRQSGGKITHANNVTTFTLGEPSARTTTLTMSMSEKPWRTNALAAVKSRTTILPSLDVPATTEKFLGK